ncbi:MAG: glycosyltransferase family 39 protein [Elusimicrobia bacterium]|nr:glycosyltransferase family 39 protein [Elusimicrobiota bacterium]
MKAKLIAFGLLLVLFVRVLMFISVATDTYDEMDYLKSGWYLAKYNTWDIESTIRHPSLSFYTHGKILNNFQFKDWDQRLFYARALMSLFSLLLGFYIFKFARELYGNKAGLIALGLYSFSPNVIAHSGLITTDILVSCFMFITVYYFWKFRDDKSKVKWVLVSGVFLGLALLSKYTAVILFAILPVFLIAENLLYKKKLKAVSFVFIILIGLFVLNLGYGFNGTFGKLDKRILRSNLFLALDKTAVLNLLPHPYVIGFDRQQHINEIGHPAFLMGKYSYHGWWYYFPTAFALKEPLPILLMILIFLLFFKYRQIGKSLPADYFLIIPVAMLVVVACFFNKNNTGFRYLLPLFPFMFVLLSNLANIKVKLIKPVFIVLLLWYAVDSLLAHPYYIAYFNELAGGSKNGYKYLADSNLDWGQDRNLVIKYMKDKKLQFNPKTPVAGKIIINANNLDDVFVLNKNTHKWLRDFKPSGNIGYSWLIYDISQSDYENILKNNPRVEKKQEILDSYVIKISTDIYFYLEKLKTEPENPVLHNNLGFVYWLKGDIDKSIAEFSKALELDPYQVEYYSNLAYVYNQKGDKKAASALMGSYRQYSGRSMMKAIYYIQYGEDKIILDNIFVLPVSEIKVM